MKKCLVCGRKLRIIKFRTLDGFLCKKCYQVVSFNYTRTVTRVSHQEISKIFEESRKNTNPKIDFEISRKMSSYIFFDDKNKYFCLTNNPKFTNLASEPVYYPYDAIKDVKLQNKELIIKGQDLYTLTVEIFLKDNDQNLIKRNIVFLSSPIDGNSNIYHTLLKLAGQIVTQLQKVADINLAASIDE